MWTSYGNVNGADCWGEGDNSGRQVSGEVTSGSGDAFGWIAADNQWQAKDGTPVLDESREYGFYAGPAGARLVDVAVTFTAAYGDVLFKDTKEGGIVSLRMRDCICAKTGGTITNALGGKGEEECWGKPSPWCDYAGPFDDGKVRGVAVFDHPGTCGIRAAGTCATTAFIGAKCFGLSYFTKKDPEPLNGDYTLKGGESLTFRYGSLCIRVTWKRPAWRIATPVSRVPRGRNGKTSPGQWPSRANRELVNQGRKGGRRFAPESNSSPYWRHKPNG